MKTILKLPTTSISVDFDKKLAIGTFTGNVSFRDYKEMLLAGAELARIGKIDSIIMDRREVNKLDTECRIWVKNEYLKVHVKPLIPKMKKVAVVQPKTILGQIYGQTVYKTLSMFYPNLTFKSFGEIEEAKEWVNPTKIVGNMVVEDFLVNKKQENEAIVSAYKEKQEAMISKREIIHQELQQVKVLETANSTSKQNTSFFDKVFNALFPGSN